MGFQAAVGASAHRSVPPIAVIIGSLALALAGCGSSSKPAYCSAKTDLMNAVKGLTSTTGHISFQQSLQKIESSSKSLVASAKGDFPTETQAIETTTVALESTLKLALSNPKQALRSLPSEVSASKAAIGQFQSATKSKCS